MPTIPPINIKKLHEFPERSGLDYDDLLHVNSTELDYKIQATKVADFVQADLFYDTLAELIAETDVEKVKAGKRVVTFANQNGAAVKQEWEIVAAATGTPDGGSYIDLTGSGLQAKQILPIAVSPSHFGAGRDASDYSANVQACWDYAQTSGAGCVGEGTYYIGSTVYLRSSFLSYSKMTLQVLPTFASGVSVDYDLLARRAIVLDSPAISVFGLLAGNTAGVDDLVGMDYGQHQIKSWRSGASGFDVNNLVRDFSISIYEGRGTGRGSSYLSKGLVAYAPDFFNEINALNIYGGEWFENHGGSIDIGDRDGIFTTTLIATDYMGNGVSLHGFPTLDQGFLSVDQVINFKGQVYFERGGSANTIACKVGGKAEDSVRGFELSGYARDYDYYVKCFAGVSGINMHDCFSRSISKCALYITTDQYPYTYARSNSGISSFTEGQQVHTGIRFSRTDNVFGNGKTIATYGLIDGENVGVTEHIYPHKVERSGRDTYTYNNNSYRYYKNPVTSKAGNLSGTTFTLTTLADCYVFNGGDAVTVGTTNTYIRLVDYDTGIIYINDGGGQSGALTISQRTMKPFLDGRSYQIPTDTTSYENGSVVWNIFTAVSTPQYWVQKSGAWVNGTA